VGVAAVVPPPPPPPPPRAPQTTTTTTTMTTTMTSRGNQQQHQKHRHYYRHEQQQQQQKRRRRRRRGRAFCKNTSDDDDDDESDERYSNDKAIEALSSNEENAWSVNVYHSKRKEHKTDELGDILSEEANDGDNILEQPGWDAQGKLRFSIMIISEELGLSEKQVEERVGQLFTLIPGLKTKVGIMKTADLVRISASIPDVYKSLVALKEVFPDADLPTMITNRPSILLEEAKEMERKVKQLREACPRLNWDAILSDHAYIFEIKNPGENCLALKEKLGTTVKDFELYVARNPMSLLSVQTGEELLEYDNGSLRQLKENLEGTPKAEGW
jgi:hypothetical protein